MLWRLRFIPLLLIGALGIGSAATPAIGVAKARGSFRLDNATVYANSTLFDGSAIETGEVSSELQLNGGARLLLASGSRGKVYRDRLVLEMGAAQLKATENYPIEARSLRVLPAGRDSTARVVLDKAGQVGVAAVNGPVQVTSAQGILVANVLAGGALNLTPQAAAAPSRVSGCLQQKDGRFLLTDMTTHVTVELQGPGLEKEVGNAVEIVGAMIPGAKPAPGATQVIRVSELKQAGRKCPVPAVGAGAAAIPVLSTGAKVAVIGGAVAATATTAAWASGVFEEEEKRPVSP